MDRIKKRKIKETNNEDLFSLFEDYVKKIIAEDLKHIYGKKAQIQDSRTPWVFHIAQ